MIVRISGEAQYDLPDTAKDELNRLESVAVAAVEGGERDAFPAAFQAVLDYVRSAGERVDDLALEGSDVILPPADTSFEEASSDFTGEGLIPD